MGVFVAEDFGCCLGALVWRDEVLGCERGEYTAIRMDVLVFGTEFGFGGWKGVGVNRFWLLCFVGLCKFGLTRRVDWLLQSLALYQFSPVGA